MTFDKPEHKEMILELLNKASVSGQFVELFYDLKKAVIAGEVAAEKESKKTPHV